VASHARVVSLEREFRSLRETLETRRAENAFLRVAMDGLCTPERLAREAARLGLQAPSREVKVTARLALAQGETPAPEPRTAPRSSQRGARDVMTATALHVAAWAQVIKGTPVQASTLDR
jgi:hypothetical protein